MHLLTQKLKERLLRKWLDDFYQQLFYRYQLAFFGGLLRRGFKIKAFNFLMMLKLKLKRKELKDPYKILLTSFMASTPSIILLPLRLGGRVVEFLCL